MSLLDDLIENATTAANAYNVNREVIEGTFSGTYVIPKGVTIIKAYGFAYWTYSSLPATTFVFPNTLKKIGTSAFYNNNQIETITLPNGLEEIMSYAFQNCPRLKSVTLPDTLLSIGSSAFWSLNLESINLPDSLREIGSNAFYNTKIESVTIPSNLRGLSADTFKNCRSLQTVDLSKYNSCFTINNTAFRGCTALEFVTLPNNFNANNLNLSASTLYSVETIVSWLNALYNRTGTSAYTLTIGTDNLQKLTAEQIAIATNKNWNLA